MARARGTRSLGLLDFFKNPTNLKIVETLIRFLTFFTLDTEFLKKPNQPQTLRVKNFDISGRFDTSVSILPRLVPEISPGVGFCDVNEQQQHDEEGLGILVVGSHFEMMVMC